MENEEVFKIVFWAAILVIFILVSGILLFLAQTYHNMLSKINKETLDNLPVDVQKNVANHILSEREIQVLLFVLKGYSAFEISDMLYISHRTVENHKKKMMEKTESKNFMGVVKYALSHRILLPEELKD